MNDDTIYGLSRMKTKGYTTYNTPSGKIRFGSYIIINRKRYHLASHPCELLAYQAHEKAIKLLNNHTVEEVKLIIRSKTLKMKDE